MRFHGPDRYILDPGNFLQRLPFKTTHHKHFFAFRWKLFDPLLYPLIKLFIYHMLFRRKSAGHHKVFFALLRFSPQFFANMMHRTVADGLKYISTETGMQCVLMFYFPKLRKHLRYDIFRT